MTFDLDPTAQNIFPAKYRQVALSYAAPSLEPAELERHFVGRDAYMRTRFLVLRVDGETALAEISTEDSGELFTPITAIRVLAEASECVWIEDDRIDVGVASQFAQLCANHSDARCLVVEGKYSHVSFLLNPQPLWVDVLDIVPPAPSKLVDQAQRILDLAEDLPPIGLVPDETSSLDMLRSSTSANSPSVLLPCRTAGVELPNADVAYLDQRPVRQDWMLLGCQRSADIHEAFYGDRPPRIDTCPRQFITAERRNAGPLITRCCLLQQGMEQQNRAVLVPWGSSLHEVREAIETVIEAEGFTWTPI
jgi:hypothetical protein